MLAQHRKAWAATLRGGCLTAFAACGFWLSSAAVAAAPGTVIRNDASLSAQSHPTVQASVSVRVGSVTFLRYLSGGAATPVARSLAAPAAVSVQPVLCAGNTFAMPSFGPVGGTGDLPALPATYSLEEAAQFRLGEPVFLRVSDPAANLSHGGRDLITLIVRTTSGDAETLQLQETGVDSGEFTGFFNTTRDPMAADCRLSVEDGAQLYAEYVTERSDPVSLVDPYGVVFDAGTGALLDGARVSLVDALTGLPATVLGDAGEPYPATVVTGSTVVTGARTYTLRPGEYRFPFVLPGRDYTLQVTRSNYVFPTARPDSEFAAPAFAGYVIAAGSRGEAFAPPTGLPLRLDLPLDAVSSGLLLVKNTSRTVAAIGDFVPYDVVASNRSGGALVGVQVRDRLPPGFRYAPGSLRQDGVAVPDPQLSADGRTLTHALGQIANKDDVRLTYVAEVTAATPLGDAVNTAIAGNTLVQSNAARATVRVREDLMRSRALLAGRVLEVAGCSAADVAAARPVPDARLYLEDGRYVVTDARGRWHFDDLRPGTHVLQLDQQGLPAGVTALPCADNSHAAGNALSRFVDLQGGSLWQEDFYVKRADSAPLRVALASGAAGELHQAGMDALAVTPDAATATGTGTAALASAATATTAATSEDKGIGLLSHRDGEVVASRVQALRVRVDARLKTVILLDGQPIPEDRLGFRKDEGQTTLMSYVGVDLGEPGPHQLHIRGTDPFGIVRVDQRMTVVVASDITRIRPAQGPVNVADGRSPIVVKVELIDASGRVAPAAVDLRLVASGGLRPWVTTDSQRALADSAAQIPVGTDGLIKFAPVTRSGLYTIEVAYNDALLKIPVYVRPEQRDWILVGLAEGSLAARTVSGNLQAAAAAGAGDEAWQDSRLAFFAKGQIQGKWLLTMAYDSSRERASAFAGAIDPERFYTLYADAADPRYDAASKEKLYLRIERDAFYALFGDFDTGMSEVELARYSRSLTGLKSEYHDQRFDLNVFAADTGRGYVKDELRGDGTSGLYRLSRRGLLAGAEKVRIEVRDRFKSEVVLSSQQLARWADYNIDYDRGELFFKSPVLSQDDSFNPVWIVVEYETELLSGDAVNAGGRAAVKLADGRAVIGVSAVQEENGINRGELRGLDTSYRLGAADSLHMELATTEQSGLLPRDGAAQQLEWKHDSQKVKGRAYYREQEGGFGLGQQAATEESTRKLGVEGRYQWQQHTALTADIFQQEMLTSGASRQVADLRGEVSHDRYGYGIGLRHVDESLPDEDRGAEQLTLGGRYTLPGNKVRVRGSLETAFLTNSESLDFPDRLLLGADWQVNRKLQLSLEQEWASSELRDTQNTRLGAQLQPWRGGKVSTQLDRETGESGQRLRSGLGLGQNMVLSPEWTADFGYDRADTLADTAGAAAFNPQVPGNFGGATSDFWAANAGANYRHQDVKGVGRIERRDADDEHRWNLVGGFYRELNPEIAVALGLETTLAERVNGDENSDVLLRGSLAWRPDDSRWLLLDRLDLGLERVRSGLGALDGRRLVNNLNANHRWEQHQISLQYGSKFVLDTIDATRYSGYTDLIGIEWRHDLSPRWDIGWRNSLLHSWTPGVLDYQYGIAVGMTPVKNAWVSLGYNVEGFVDADFSAGEYTAQGLYLKMRLKVDQHSIRQIWNDARGVFGRGSDGASPAIVDATPAAAPAGPAATVVSDGASLPAAAAASLEALAEAPSSPASALSPVVPVVVSPLAPASARTGIEGQTEAPAPAQTEAPAPVPAATAIPAATPAPVQAQASGAATVSAPALPAGAATVAAPPAASRALAVPAQPRRAARRRSAPKPAAAVAAAAATEPAPRRLTAEQKALILQRARAKRDLAEMQSKEQAKQAKQTKQATANSPLSPDERKRRRERLEQNERKVKKLIEEKKARSQP